MAHAPRIASDREALRQIRCLVNLEDDDLAAVAKQCAWRRFTSGQQVISKSSKDRDVYLVVKGKVRATAFSSSGRQVTYNDIGPGECFGDFAALDGLARSADVVAIEDTLTASLEPGTFRKLLREHPDICEAMMLKLLRSVRDLTERLFDLSTLGLQNRVHAEILRLTRNSTIADNRAVIEPSPRHVDIANRVSANREQVTRELSRMKRQGLIETRRNAMVIADVARLEQLVENVRRHA